ncbi:Urease accessory protein ureD [Methyloversatilis universalis FAM5]|uniref:Urease accessory protein UreD n=1 Tax=Methyloversatilis universalis (strain ATCC BAA-1314 / DSM 25237 / JCM 13912 / CCUG 52030 / FAM5) TaxID=1000565 RepID=F5RGQ1_METUF|nr:urease accessory protein UreD [Methyloversatilis universalis]EGK70105.1 Urease accessory protein ureD [Methyloversatilis universalis FAM5]
MTPAPVPADAAGTECGWPASLSLAYRALDHRTVLAHRAHHGPLRVQKALYPEGPAVCHTLLLHPPSGIAGGDRLQVDVEVGPAAHALLTTPGAAKWYRSAGPLAQAEQRLRVAAGGLLEWLPQEAIVFDGARARASTCVDLAAGGRFIGMDLWCLGRTASGERYRSGRLAVDTRIRLGGRTIWLEQARIAGDAPLLGSVAGLAGAPVFGTLIAAGLDADDALLAACRALPDPGGHGGVTRLPHLLVARWRGDCTQAARAWFVHLWSLIRPALAGRPAQTPRIWNT